MQLYRTATYTDDERRRAFACVCVYIERVELTCYPWWICNEQSRCVRAAVRWVVCQPPLSDRSGARRRIGPRKQQEKRADDKSTIQRRQEEEATSETEHHSKCDRLNNRKRNENKREKGSYKKRKENRKKIEEKRGQKDKSSAALTYIDDKR